MFVNENEINKKFRPQIKGTLKNIENAEKILSSIDIPKDFKYYTDVKNMGKSFNESKIEIKLIDKAVDKFINDINAVENKNKKIVDSLMNIGNKTEISKTSNKSLSGTAFNLGREISEIQSKIGEGAVQLVKKQIQYNQDKQKMQIETGAKIVSKVGSAFKNTVSTGAKFVKGFACKTRDICKSAINKVGAKITSAFTTIKNKVIDFAKTAVANVTNVFISITKGLADFGQALVDFLAIAGSVICTPFTAAYDKIKHLITGNEDGGTATSKMWKNTMSFVSTDYVGNAFGAFYKGTAVGKWLDKNASECCRSDGAICILGEGIGYVAGVVALTLATAGIGTAAVGAAEAGTVGATVISNGLIGAVYSGIAGFGKGTQENWSKRKEESWQGIEEKYQKGEISNEQYENYQKIRLMTKEQWDEVELNYKNGNISKKDFEQMKKIREMQDDWRTMENGAKGIGAGVANGFWEGIQWYLGGKLAGKTILKGSSALANSAARVGIDSTFNGLDVPFRTIVEAVTSDESLKEAWQNQGGWTSMGMNLAIGLIGSTGGEFKDKIKNGLSVESKNLDIDSVDKIKGKVKDTANIELKTVDDVIKFSLEQDGKKATKENVNKIMKEIEKGDYSSITNKGYLREQLENSLKDSKEQVKNIGKSTNTSKLKIDDIESKSVHDELSDFLKKRGIEPTEKNIKELANEMNKVSELGLDKYNFKEAVKNIGEPNLNSVKTVDDAIKYTLKKHGKEVTEEEISKVKIALKNGEYDYVTRDGDLRNFVQQIYKEKFSTVEDLFIDTYNIRNKYGVDQGIFKDMYCWYTADGRKINWRGIDAYSRQGTKLRKVANQEYMEFKNILTKEYNFSYMDASKVIAGIDSIGACSYADVANNIFGEFKNNPEEFKKRFGFNMFKKDGSLNDTRLLADLYVFANSSENGGNLFFTDVNGKKYVNQNYQKDFNGNFKFDQQIYFSSTGGMNEELIQKYLKDKSCSIKTKNIYVQDNWKFTKNGYAKNITKKEMNRIKKTAREEIDKGKQLSLGIYVTQGKPIRMIDYDTKTIIETTDTWGEGGGHALKITGMNNEGFIVSTWGMKALVPFEDLKNAGSFTVMSSEINLK